MRFTEHLSAHITPEWRKQYINYEEMKAMLYLAVEEAPSAEIVEQEVVTRFFASFDENFFQYCENELTKINTFYSEKLAEATRKFASLHSELKSSIQSSMPGNKASFKNFLGSGTGRVGDVLQRPDAPARKLQELKLAFSEFYLSLILLQNYQNLNFTGFRKILKKHDKLLSVESGLRWQEERVATSHFYTVKEIDRMIRETEATVTNQLEGGDRQKAMKRLRVPPLGEQQSPWTTFKVGLFSGSFVILFIAVVLSAIFQQERSDWYVVLRLYRGPLVLVEFIFLMGVNVYGWRSSGVNHVLIFELDPRNHLSEQHLMELASIFGVVWALSMLGFLYSSSLSIPPYANPLALAVIMLIFLVNPLHVFRHEARFWAMREIGRIIAAPFFHVGFADFWLADQMNSLAATFLDFQYLICFYSTTENWLVAGDTSQCNEKSFIIRPIVNCLPAWFRFAQCLRRYRDTKEGFPHLVNAGKYSTTFFVVIFATLKSFYAGNYESQFENPFVHLWIIANVINSCYAYTWDIKMDWGLFDKKVGDNKFLREEIVYSSPFFYYFGIVEDLVLRFAWAISYGLQQAELVNGEVMTTILSPLEVFRRFVWNYFRLENEHLNNCGKFRAVRDISVAPINSSDQKIIVTMMDDENGVSNRRAKKSKKKDDKIPLLKATTAIAIVE
ncbi:xenotropic and polytropic retrovirus receptor 1-like [Ischnura elegans]|uniref:xenotropic and polytropic retrovirus receptor 1-like n=1 Tax=Ischnura elegans TaxID=197161 RepID=UPI001ED8AF6E|nr:xenotropic and polytropic retrovirus receptor 1-like [Ischnura elegans]XP_046401370.1 xenotropic and polytropic retrovirus receptor 1-like [Ischnura elegans]XP_046401371.1 xenotropic and polytropic retrovirus receptor 1-like [Ischnura elegans]XP_046401372.1 xenotropic and polytropic retrovirus receptor 1-like [Ischnura elegans]XP_046401373.1 xenotropic and polytropic retrovirus receptor 1-like [Ischnura elegans]